MKARVAAGGQLRDLVYAAPEELRSQLRRSQTTKAALRALARRWHHLQAELDALDVELTKLVSTAAPALLALPGIGLDTAGQLLVTAGTPRGGWAARPPSRGCVA